MKYLKILLLVFITTNLSAQKEGYNIQITLENYPDSVVYLVNYFGNTNQINDTVYLQGGKFTFKGSKSLPGGIYLIVTKDRKYFEVLIDKEQYFTVSTSYNDFVGKAKIKGSQDNIDFYNYLNFLAQKEKEKSTIEAEYKAMANDAAAKTEMNSKLTKLNEEVNSYKEKIILEKPNSFLTTILYASKEPEIPKVLPLKEDGTSDSSYIYKYYKEHFFDGFDLSDERLLRTPLYATKLKKYFKQVILQHPDTLIKEADMLIGKAKPNRETYKFNIWYFTYETETSQIMGMDAVFVHLVNKYYKTGEAYWVNEKVLKNITDRADVLEKLLIGKPGPNMIMWDTTSNLKSLYDIKADYTIIMFWDPDCGHCRTEIPEIKTWTDENGEKYNVKIFSVCSDTNLVKWRKFLRDYKMTEWENVNGTRSATANYHDLYDIISTPTIYLLDKNKKILAKRLGAKQVFEFIARDHRIKTQKEKKD
jgi:thiol-disulfide isomerase/thioredoxin